MAQLHGIAVRSVYPSLEDIFVSFTRRMDRQAGRE
jgi:hypothetical protein